MAQERWEIAGCVGAWVGTGSRFGVCRWMGREDLGVSWGRYYCCIVEWVVDRRVDGRNFGGGDGMIAKIECKNALNVFVQAWLRYET